MPAPIPPTLPLKYQRGVTLVGGAPADPATLARSLAVAPHLVAADGGADRAARLGHVPEAIIGDMDSVVNLDSWRNSGIHIRHIQEQTTTDFEKSLYSIDAPLIVGVGFLGGRADHALAALSAMMAHRDRPVILLGQEDVVFHCPAVLRLDLPAGMRLSVFPLAPVTGTSSRGLEWSVEGLALAPGGRYGTSNRTTGAPVELAFDSPGALILLPPETLPRVAALMTAAVSTRGR